MKKTAAVWVWAGLAILICSQVFGQYSGGDGNETSPYRISNSNDWQELIEEPNDWGQCFLLTSDINLADVNVMPVGDLNTPFAGIFDGNDHIIRNLIINIQDKPYAGLFGYVSTEGQIKNIGVEDINIIGCQYVGGLVGYNNGIISKCYTSGSVCSDSLNVNVHCGGLVGSNNGTLSYCYAKGNVRSVSISNAVAGGLVGSASGNIRNCYSTANVYADANSLSAYAGGLVGNNSATISNCYSTGSVDSNSLSSFLFSYIGGLIGKNVSGTISCCYSTGFISSTSTLATIGGFAGENNGSVTYCFWDKETSGQTSSAGGTGKTTDEMKDQSTYGFSWRFADESNYIGNNYYSWFMQNGNYPILVWQVSDSVLIPDLKAKTLEQAKSILNNLGISVEGAYLIYDLSVEPGLVAGTKPASGTMIYSGLTKLKVFIAKTAKYSGGDGTTENPYKISKIDNWQELVNCPNDWDKCFVLSSDIDLAGKNVAPIGNSATKFTGVFDGNDHVIRNVTINLPNTSYVGLFGYVGGLIKNLSVEDVNVIGNSYTGGLAGYNYGTISNCFSSGFISSSNLILDTIYIGGLVGYSSNEIFNCHSNCQISASSYFARYVYAGGLLGYGSGAKITNSYAIGDVNSISKASNSIAYAGGLIGKMSFSGMISNCYATGNSYSSGPNTRTGGLIAASDGTNITISSCYSTGSVFTYPTLTSYFNYTGGLAGWNSGRIINCFSLSYVFSSSTSRYVGGFVGNNAGNNSLITGSFWNTETSGQTIAVGYGSSNGITGKTTAEMKNPATFIDVGWKVVKENSYGGDAWIFHEGNYPIQGWQVYKTVIMPDLKGKTIIEAESILNNLGILIKDTYEIYDLSVEPNLIAKTNPFSGTTIYSGVTTIDLFAARNTKYAGGDGSNENPYQIATQWDWNALITYPEDWNKNFKLTANINLAEMLLTPIGNSTNRFTGSFDGNCKRISNVTINSPDTDYIGLFGYLQDGQIKNLGVENMSIIGKNYVGLIGYNYKGTISKCYSRGSVSSSNYAGGLVGYSSGIINDCYSIGSVSSSTTSSNVYYCVGGLVGYGVGIGTISNCYAASSVSTFSLDDHVGGLMGYGTTIPIASFWDIEKNNVQGSYGSKGLTTGEMKSLLNYQRAGWSGNGWVMQDGIDYPHLAWEGTDGIPIPEAEPISLAGSGTTEDPYQIWTAEDFALLSCYTSVLDSNIILMADVNLADKLLYPIGNLGPFTGKFDGNGHILSNMNINMPHSCNIGLFGNMSAASEIFNLKVADANIIGRDNVGILAGYNSSGNIIGCYTTGIARSDWYCGGIIGYNINGKIIDCNVTTSVNAYEYVGGLAGRNSGSMIANCNVDCKVQGSIRVGGMIGYNEYNSIIQNCNIRGTVYGGDNTGGLVGTNYRGTILKCNSLVDVNGYNGSIGGLVGKNSDVITKCKATGVVNGYSLVGGLVGDNSGTISDSDTSGSIISGPDSACGGGLIGNNSGTIFNCYYSGSVLCYASFSSSYAGGLIGKNSGEIDFCFSTGSVSSSIKSYSTSNTYAGGLIGYNRGKIDCCYSSSQVSASILTDPNYNSQNNNAYSGGFVGYCLGDKQISFCYSNGMVTASAAYNSKAYTGGLIAYKDSFAITSSFWDKETSGKTTSAGGTGLTTEQMKSQSTFSSAGWDFSDIDGNSADWMMLREGEDYPRLAWQRIYPGDITGLYGVSYVDYAKIAAHWGQTDCPNSCENADINNDGTVNVFDLMFLADNWLNGI